MQIRKASSDGNGIAAVIDFVGSDKTFALSQSVLRRGGQAIQVSPFAPGPVSSTPLPRTGLELSPISELGVHPEFFRRATCIRIYDCTRLCAGPSGRASRRDHQDAPCNGDLQEREDSRNAHWVSVRGACVCVCRKSPRSLFLEEHSFVLDSGGCLHPSIQTQPRAVACGRGCGTNVRGGVALHRGGLTKLAVCVRWGTAVCRNARLDSRWRGCANPTSLSTTLGNQPSC
jgi:hypothetical protein